MFTLWMIVINTSFWLICCIGVAYLVRVLPSFLYKENALFKEYSFEKRLYKKIRVAKWKDKMPELGSVFGFQKKHLDKKLDEAYIDKFILETKYAEIGHLGMAILGFGCILVNPSDQFIMALCCSIANVFIQIPFCLIQRYNRPRLFRLKKKIDLLRRNSFEK